MRFFNDQAGNAISLQGVPKRIVSLVPSQTELLFTLGLESEVVGITKFCVHPQSWFHSKIRVGGTKDVKFNIIDQLQPDLIIANKEENSKEQIDVLSKKYSVWVSDVNNLESAYNMIAAIGKMTGTDTKAIKLIDEIKTGFTNLHAAVQQPNPLTVCYLIWQHPFMTIGGDTFINSMLESCNFANVFASQKRYPEITVDDIRKSGCKMLLLPSEPFPFKEKHVEALQKELPGIMIKLVDGEMFSWYGSRLLYASAYFKSIVKEVLLTCKIEKR